MIGNRRRLQLPEQLTNAEFEFVQTLVKEQTAITLDTSKIYLINARLLPVARNAGFPSVVALIRHLRSKPMSELHSTTVEAIVTTETSFFRDHFPFASLREEVIPDLIRRSNQGHRSINIWSAGCASGQEPYSTAMMLRESFPQLGGWTVRLMASDVSNGMLERARSGIYSQIEVNRGLPAHLLVKYFRQCESTWHINDDIKGMVTFFRNNLARDTPTVPPIDIMMLRNVLIYFDVETKREILSRVRRHLRPGGLLVLGTAETTLNLDSRYERVRIGRAVFYRAGPSEAR